jgi:type I restriction enzyme S subunit
VRFPAYSKYKASGVEWLGSVPEHWDVLATRRVSRRITTGSTPLTSEEHYYEDGSVPWFGPGSFDDKIALSEPVKRLNVSAVNDGAARLFRIGATMVVTIGATLGKVSSLFAQGSCNQQITVVEFEERRVFPRYGTYQFKRLEGALRAVAPSATLPILARNDIAEISITLPPFAEQCAIAKFLDAETATLDTLVAKRQELIEKLKEKRSALISRTVTRGLPLETARAAGLNPNPKFKPSGIEWLGEIPEHWQVRRLKFYLVRMEQGWSPQCENIPALGEEWGVLKVGAVNGAEFNPTENKRLPEGEEILPEYEIRVGDFLISRANTRELLGGAAIVRTLESRLLLCDKLYRLKLKTEALSPDFLLFFIRSIAGHFEFEREATGASDSMQNISQSAVRNLWVTVPPAPEQRVIADFLDRETLKIDRMVAKVEEAIERLQEYRTALITAAVTGKIDVRNVRHSGENRNPGDIEGDGHRPSSV